MNTDMSLIRAHIREAKEKGMIISHSCARTIAGMYHGGQGSTGYVFLSTGAIEPGLYSDLFPQPISGDMGHDLMASAMSEYINFWTMVTPDKTRGPIDGWDNLWIDKTTVLELAEQIEEPMPAGTETPELFFVKIKQGRQWYADSEGETFTVFYDGVSGFRVWQYGRPGRGWIMPEDCVTLNGEGLEMVWHKHEHPKNAVPISYSVQELHNVLYDLITANRHTHPVFVCDETPAGPGSTHLGNFRAINHVNVDVEGKIYLVLREGQVDVKVL